jgi:serine/threonine protein kinase
MFWFAKPVLTEGLCKRKNFSLACYTSMWLKKVPKGKVKKDEDFAKKYKDHNFAHVVKIYESFYEEDMFCVIMELCPNGPLSDFIDFCKTTIGDIKESVFF